MTEGEIKNCGACKSPLIHVSVTKTWNNKTETKLQWQNVEDHKPHFKFAGEDQDGKAKYNCIMPIETTTPETKPEVKPEIKTSIMVDSPFAEAELITRWAGERAYKIVMAEVSDYSRLTPQEKSALGQKTGMLTRCLADLTIELMKMHSVKSKYGDGV